MFEIKLDGYAQALEMFDSKIVDKSAYRALNRAVSSGRTEASKHIYAKWNIKKRDINRAVRAIKAQRSGGITAFINAKGRPLSLTYFGAKEYAPYATISRAGRKPRQTRNRRRKGVYVTILRGESQTHKPQSFIQSMRSGHVGVFERVGKSCYLIVERKTITIASMFDQANAMRPTVDAIEDSWRQEFFRQLELNEYGA